MGKLSDWISGVSSPATVITDTVMGVADGAADIVDRFVTNPAEKEAALQALRADQLEQQKVAMKADAAILADRQSARAMSGVHGKLQTQVAVIFLIAFFVFLAADITFIGWIAWQTLRPENAGVDVPDWVQMLITNTLTGVLAYMVSMVKEIIGFLFGGSAGGDATGAAMAENLRIKPTEKEAPIDK